MTPEIHKGDLPSGIDFGTSVAVDSETMGLNLQRDRLCLVQLKTARGDVHLVQFAEGAYKAPNLVKMLADPKITKIFHFARFDMAAFARYLGQMPVNVYCTKVASKLARTYTDRHGLKDICRELLNVEISKEQQSSDWGSAALTEAQIKYAAADVLYLHELKEKLDDMLARENRQDLAKACFGFLAHRVQLDLGGWPEIDIFAH